MWQKMGIPWLQRRRPMVQGGREYRQSIQYLQMRDTRHTVAVVSTIIFTPYEGRIDSELLRWIVVF
jgi:hypothetical protein